ncbi:hypothetical protein JCM8547_006896 [Rhodosporidiobolus lusitaniae]
MSPPPSTASPSSSPKDSILDALWPLSRFVGYRPPPPPPGAHHQTSSWVDHVLPAPLRERHREKRRREGGVELGSRGGSRGTGDDGESGGKEGEQQDPPPPSLRKKVGDKAWNMWLTLLGSFFSTAFLALCARAPFLTAQSAPIVIGAFGAEGVLLYAAHTSPLTQPRCVVFGNTVSAIMGVCVAKLFGKVEGFEVGQVFGVNWAASAVSLALALFVMQLFEITHPPGGATALLAVTIPQISKMGWWYVPDILVSSLIMLAWALIINNLGGRRYPTQWWWSSKWIVI